MSITATPKLVPSVTSPNEEAIDIGLVTGRGPLSPLENNTYDFKRTSYPLEGLGQEEVPSYVIFYINLPEVEKYKSSSENFVEGVTSTSSENLDRSRRENPNRGGGIDFRNPEAAARTALTSLGGAKDAVIGTVTVAGLSATQPGFGLKLLGAGIGGAVASTQLVRKPKTKRIKEAIAIYMPDTVFHRDAHDYDRQSLTSALGLVGLGGRIGDQTDSNETLARLASMTGAVTEEFVDFVVRSKGYAINPQVEMIYKGTGFRSFNMEFKFQPRSLKERDAINQIIYTFRRYAAPDLDTDKGYHFIPPAEFDIQYFFRDSENRNISRVTSCVLTNIDVDYSPNGQWTTFTDGQPIEIRVVLTFTEVDIITRDMVDAGF